MSEQNQNTPTPVKVNVDQPTKPIQPTRKIRRRKLAAW